MGFEPSSVSREAPAVATLSDAFIAFVFNQAVATATAKEVLLQTGPIFPLVYFDMETTGDAQLDFYEDTVITAPGTPSIIMDVNRLNPIVPGMTVNRAPTLTSDGTLLLSGLVLGGSNGQSSKNAGSTFMVPIPLILKPNANYMMRLTNLTGGDISAQTKVSWVEGTIDAGVLPG